MSASNGDHRAAIQAESDAVFDRLRTHLADRERLAVVKAPPGSGKTRLLLRLAEAAIKLGYRVAIAAQTNSQTDDICRRLARDHSEVPAIRFAAGGTTRRDLGASVDWVWKAAELPLEPSVVVGTTAKWSMVNIDPAFDVLFVDEAWQMSWADFMLCGGVSERFVLIGDPGQIPPVVPIPVDRWETSPRAPHVPAPALILGDPSVGCSPEDLPASRRLPSDAVELILPFYDFEFSAWALPDERFVRVGRAKDGGDQVDGALDLLAEGTVAGMTLETPDIGPPLEADLEVARAVAHLVKRILDREPMAADEDEGKPEVLSPEHIGISATHRVMNGAIADALGGRLRSLISVDTPERWQGLERKLMIVVHPLSSVVHPSSFDLNTGRLCVMMSRHRSGLLVVSRDHIRKTLETHIPLADQAIGRPDVSGRGHGDNLDLWQSLEDRQRILSLAA
jgi:hypothetical protein